MRESGSRAERIYATSSTPIAFLLAYLYQIPNEMKDET